MESFRHSLKALLVPLRLRIRRGPLHGLKWVLTSGSKFIQGTYEPTQTALFMDCVREGHVVFDVGAHVGYYTALASIRTGSTGRVIAFEPRPLNLRFLRCHLRLNHLANVTVIESCVGETTGEARFDTRTGTGTGHLSDDGELPVKLVSLDGLVQQGTIPAPHVIKMDVEGAELRVLAGAENILRTARPILLISTHGPDNYRGVITCLEARNYAHELIRDANACADREVIARPRA